MVRSCRSSAWPRGWKRRRPWRPTAGGSLVALTAEGLDPKATYALWLTPPGGGYRERVAAGTFRPDSDGRVDVRLRSALPAEEMGRVWVTTPEGDIAMDTVPA